MMRSTVRCDDMHACTHAPSRAPPQPCGSIRRHRLDVDTVGRGTECGVVLPGWADFRPGDVLQCVRMVRVRTRTVAGEGGGVRVADEA